MADPIDQIPGKPQPGKLLRGCMRDLELALERIPKQHEESRLVIMGVCGRLWSTIKRCRKVRKEKLLMDLKAIEDVAGEAEKAFKAVLEGVKQPREGVKGAHNMFDPKARDYPQNNPDPITDRGRCGLSYESFEALWTFHLDHHGSIPLSSRWFARRFCSVEENERLKDMEHQRVSEAGNQRLAEMEHRRLMEMEDEGFNSA